MLYFLRDLNGSAAAVFFISAFHAILFLQSGLDKVFDYTGNRQWLDEHFGKSILKNSVGALLPVLTLLELASGIVSAAAALLFFVGFSKATALAGFSLSAGSFLALFFGQRVAKEYAGASSIAIYFAVNMIGLLALLYL